MGSHQKISVLVLLNVLGLILRQYNLARGLLSEVMYQRNRALFIHLPVFNYVGFHKVNCTLILMKFIQYMSGMMMTRFLTNQLGKWGVDNIFLYKPTLVNKRVEELY